MKLSVMVGQSLSYKAIRRELDRSAGRPSLVGHIEGY